MKLTSLHLIIGVLIVAAFFAVVGLVGYTLYGPGVRLDVPQIMLDFGRATSTNESTSEAIPATPAAEVLAGRPGVLFECNGNRALKAEFLDGSVRLSLSDGRNLTLPQTVTEEGEIRYSNTNDSFIFRNLGDVVFIEEGGVRTYENCTAA